MVTGNSNDTEASVTGRFLPFFMVFVLGVFSLLTSCSRDDNILRVGDRTMTTSEFKEVVEQRLGGEEALNNLTYDKALEYLDGQVNQRLRILEAYRLGLDTVQYVQVYHSQVLTSMAISKLYSDEVVDHVITEEDLREYVRKILRECTPGGRFSLGSGNTIANYIPVSNYLAMLDEGRRWHGL